MIYRVKRLLPGDSHKPRTSHAITVGETGDRKLALRYKKRLERETGFTNMPFFIEDAEAPLNPDLEIELT